MIEATSQGQDYQLMAGKHQMSFFVRAELRVCQLTIFWIRKNDIITYIGICSIAVSRNPLEILFQCMQQFFKWPKQQTFCELLFWKTISPTGPQILLVRRWSVTYGSLFLCMQFCFVFTCFCFFTTHAGLDKICLDYYANQWFCYKSIQMHVSANENIQLVFPFLLKKELIYDSYFKVLKFNSCP